MPAPLTTPTTSDDGHAYDPPVPYRATDGPPDYAATPTGSPDLNDGDETPLIVRKHGRGSRLSALTVAEFSRELSQCLEDVTTLRTTLKAIQELRQSAIAPQNDVPPPASAVSMHAALARRTTSAATLASSICSTLRSLVATIDFLKPTPGSVVVSTAETAQLRKELVEAAESLLSAFGTIGVLRETDERDREQARMRLLRRIKARDGRNSTQAELMAELISAERKGDAAPEELEVGSQEWFWSVERPGIRLSRDVAELGDLGFVERTARMAMPASSAWAAPWSLVPTLYASSARKSSGYSAAGTKESMPIDANDEEATGSYGEPLEAARKGPPSLAKRWAVVLVLLVVLAASGVGIAFWLKSVNRATSTREGSPVASSTTFVNFSPEHATSLSSS
ncbi:hypothetical protein JCM10212_002303 [Sporobolomyces blumeae]